MSVRNHDEINPTQKPVPDAARHSIHHHAAINLDRTRIVFPESDKASSLKVENQSKALPYLALSWIEDENGRKEDTHFMALPPIQRIEAGSASQVRIVKQAATSQLPKDRESLFYFNLREVPPKSTSASDERSVMQVAMQSRIKLFWRPKAITKNPVSRRKCAWKFQPLRKG
jgi:P pilus assembly chaperone PapD